MLGRLKTDGSPGGHIDYVIKNLEKRGVLGPLLNKRSGLSIRNVALLYKQLFRPMTDVASLPGGPTLAPIGEAGSAPI